MLIANPRSQPAWALWKEDRTGSQLLLHPGQQGQGRHLGPGHLGRLSHQPEEVHPRHQDGVCWTEEEEG